MSKKRRKVVNPSMNPSQNPSMNHSCLALSATPPVNPAVSAKLGGDSLRSFRKDIQYAAGRPQLLVDGQTIQIRRRL